MMSRHREVAAAVAIAKYVFAIAKLHFFPINRIKGPINLFIMVVNNRLVKNTHPPPAGSL